MSRPDKDRYGALVLSLDKLAANATNRPPARAMVVSDLREPYAPHIFLRGKPGAPGTRGASGLSPGAQWRSGTAVRFRKWSTGAGGGPRCSRKPLTARVFVNRVWMEHFGEPLVSTPSDFGARSEPPVIPGCWTGFPPSSSGPDGA